MIPQTSASRQLSQLGIPKRRKFWRSERYEFVLGSQMGKESFGSLAARWSDIDEVAVSRSDDGVRSPVAGDLVLAENEPSSNGNIGRILHDPPVDVRVT